MTSGGINFLHQFRKKITKQQSRDLLFFRYAAGALGVVAILTLLAVGASFWLQYRVSANGDRIKDLQRQILLQEDVERSVVILTRKLGVLGELLEQRQDKQAAIEYFTQLFGPEVLLEEIDYADSESILSLRVKVPSVFSVDAIFAQLESAQTRERYGVVKMSELRRDKEGQYSFVITVVLTKSQGATP